MRQHTLYTEVVARVAQRADVSGGVVTPECCIVAVAVPRLQAKKPLMPGQSAVLHGTHSTCTRATDDVRKAESVWFSRTSSFFCHFGSANFCF